MHEFWYDFMKTKHRQKSELCYMGRDSLIVYIKNVEKKFDTSNYELVRPLTSVKNKEVIKNKDEIGGKIMIEFVALTGKGYSYLEDDIDENKT